MNEIEIARNYLQTLLEIERAPQAQLDAYQQDLVASLYRHARRNVPFYQDYPEISDPPDLASAEWRSLPLVSRRDLTEHANSITSRSMPQSHGVIAPVQTGGSTGTPARVVLSSLESIARIACSYRMFLAWKLDVSRPLVSLRKPQTGWNRSDGPGFRRWGFPWLPESTLGPRIQYGHRDTGSRTTGLHCPQRSGLREYAAVQHS